MTGSIRAYARSRSVRGLPGGSDTAVRKHIATGRIVLVDGNVDFEQADEAWARNKFMASGATEGKSLTVPIVQRHAAVDDTADRAAYASARTRREQAEAEQSELKLAQLKREVLPREEVERAFGQIGKIYAGGRATIPAQLATRLVGKTDLQQIQRAIVEALNESDTNICAELDARFPDLVRHGSNTGDL